MAYNGLDGTNLHSRVVPQAPSALPVISGSVHPVQARAMTKRDSPTCGAGTAKQWTGRCGPGSTWSTCTRPLPRRGPPLPVAALQPPQRLLRRKPPQPDAAAAGALEDAIEEVAGRAAVACRVTVDETMYRDGIDRAEIEEVIGELGEIPDLWDFVPGTWEDDSVTSRFSAEAHEEQWVRGLKALTSQTGRRGRPLHLPRHHGPHDPPRHPRLHRRGPALHRRPVPAPQDRGGPAEDIRECIGCNICVTGDYTMSPIRCTQNPSMGEEWRRGWHPENYRPRHAAEKVLVVGADRPAWRRPWR